MTGQLEPEHLIESVEKHRAVDIHLFNSFNQVCESPSQALSEQVSAVTFRIENCYYIAQNEAHGLTRRRASLMEELAHIWLGHRPSTVSLRPNELSRYRSFDPQQEKEAYALGTAVLVPYLELREKALLSQASLDELAAFYDVSPALIKFRLQTTYIWRELKAEGTLEIVLAR